MKYILVVILMAWASVVFSREVPPKFLCDKCGKDITTVIAASACAETDIRTVDWRDDSERIKYYHLCREHMRIYKLIMKSWLRN